MLLQFEHDDCNERMPELQKQLIEMFEDATSLVNMVLNHLLRSLSLTS